jgi:hypothetical protein
LKKGEFTIVDHRHCSLAGQGRERLWVPGATRVRVRADATVRDRRTISLI